ncbi:M13 family metallopeptidase [Riemerella columbipharyngis]|uniref:Putative endopeptidase n=1 Tax=Riemerella columbipharyngis TaxID=1071918 RepID=A0A1G6ZLQ5_9FLAO|nr:M13 family metallopeptidase [Riemerella columbipharyngis]SDE03578.1 putative endopeptidase [Riemerella columbipharyngis]
MKKVTIAVLALSGAVSLTSCSTMQKTAVKPEKKVVVQLNDPNEHGLKINEMDTSVRPQDNFYNYVNGGWMKTAEIPSDKASWGSFNELRENTDNNCLSILDNILKDHFPANSEGEKIQNLYASYIDMDKRNAEGIKPIQSDLAKIDAIKSIKDLQAYFVDRVKYGGGNPFYDWSVYADMKNSKMNAIYLNGPRLGLGRDYYQKENAENTKTIAEYQKYVAKLLGILGYKDPEATASRIVALEKDFAKSLLTLEEGRDANKRYNPKTSAELSQLSKNIDLSAYLKQVGVDTNKVIIGEIKYYENLDRFLNEKNLPLIKDYLKEKLLASNASNLDKNLDEISFNFYGKYLQGQKEQRPMNKRALGIINGILGEAFGKLYVQKYFPAEAKTQMEILIGYLIKSYDEHIKNLKWMSDETKQKALEKLNKIMVKVAYPDKWEDYSALALNGNNLYENLKQVNEWEYNKSLKEEVNKPVDKSKWGMSPQTVNAYYNPSNNEIVFPAAILQPPFFNFKADPAVNFGGIGAVIGHEISHGFDDGGSQFDADGNLKNWWTKEDRKNFEEKVKELASQYNKYEPVKGSFVNGVFTSGENIADLGGVSIAYTALQMYLKDHGTPDKISGFTQEQRFFLSWGTVWRTKSTSQYMVNQVKTDPHSPGYFRSFGPLVNTNGWYDAFGVKKGDKLYKAPKDRIVIW